MKVFVARSWPEGMKSQEINRRGGDVAVNMDARRQCVTMVTKHARIHFGILCDDVFIWNVIT